MEGLALLYVQGLGQQPEIGGPQGDPHQGEKPEDAVPSRVDKKPPADDGGDRRSHSKIDGDLAHYLLGLGRRKHIADHRARDHNARSGGQALQRAEENQLPDRL